MLRNLESFWQEVERGKIKEVKNKKEKSKQNRCARHAHIVCICLRLFSLLDALVSLLDSSASLLSRWERGGIFARGGTRSGCRCSLVPLLQPRLLSVQPVSSPSRGTAAATQPLLALRFVLTPATASRAELLQGALSGGPVCLVIDLHVDLSPQLCFYP